jgi:Arc/MetJ-type ribon-helix-helix transcriptional regulator
MEKQQKEVFQEAEAAFSFLAKSGFESARSSREGSMTTLRWLHSRIGLELELDWHEFYAFLMVVRLEDGHLPDGYYVSRGEAVRFHLLSMAQERGWDLPRGLLDRLKARGANDQRPRTTAEILSLIEVYAEATRALLPRLLAPVEEVFPGSRQ